MTLLSAPIEDLTTRMQACYLRYQKTSALSEDQALLNELLAQHAALLAQTIIRKKLIGHHPADAQEVQQQVHLKLLARLRSTSETPLQDFPAYVAVVAYNACAEWQRQRQPRRHGLKNRVRYLLNHTNGLALWEATPRVWWGGYSKWREHEKSAALPQLQACRSRLPNTKGLRELVTAVFSLASQPVELDDLVSLLADVLGISDEVIALESNSELPDERSSIASVVERRACLQQLWNEVRKLPLAQRRALLLNLRDQDGGNQLALFHLTGVASLPELAKTLEFSLEKFAALWNQLPIDDLSLAAQLGVTRQQVINLRLAARRRLARHLNPAKLF